VSKLSKKEANAIINNWYKSLDDSVENYKFNTSSHKEESNANHLKVVPGIEDIQKEIYLNLLIKHKSEHRALMLEIANNPISFKSINALLSKNTLSGQIVSAIDIFIDLSIIAFSNIYLGKDIDITESKKNKLITNVHKKYKGLINALEELDIAVGANQAPLYAGLYKKHTSRVIEYWTAKGKTVSKITNKNAKRLDMFGQFAMYINNNYGSPYWEDVLGLTSAFYDCGDTDAANVRGTLSKKLSLTRRAKKK